jgi:hypothetical protein
MDTQSVPPAPRVALVIDATARLEQRKAREGQFSAVAADKIIEDVVGMLSLLEAYAYLDNERVFLDSHAVSAASSTLVEKLRRAQRYLRGEE